MMAHRFNPNTNPYADDLLKLNLVPTLRFSVSERRAFARILVGKLYELEMLDLNSRRFHPMWRAIHFDKRSGQPVDIDVFFDLDLRAKKLPSWFVERPRMGNLIALSVGVNGVVQLFNGSWDGDTNQKILDAIKRIDTKEGTFEDAQENDEIPIRSDEDVKRDYLGEGRKDQGTPGGSGGDGDQRGGRGGAGGSGSDGENGGVGAGGIGEVLNHPVLFSVEKSVLDAILEQI